MITKIDEFHKAFFELSKDAILVSDGEKYIDCNQSAMMMLGYNSKNEIIDTYPSEHAIKYQFDGKKSSEKINELYELAIEKGNVQYEWSLKKKNGQPLTIAVFLTYVSDKQNKIIYEVWREIKYKRENDEVINTLYNISNAVNTTLNLDELYKSIHKILHRVIDASNFFIALYDKDKDLLWFPYERDEKFKYEKIENASKSKAMSIKVIKKNKTLLVGKSAFDKNYPWGQVEQWLGVPLNVKGEVIGVIVVQSYNTPDLYTDKDIKFLTAVSDQIGLAIDRKRSEEALIASESNVKRLSKQTEEFSLVAASIISMKNEKEIFKRICKAIVEHSDFNSIIISYFTNTSPFRDILGYEGIDDDVIKDIHNIDSPISIYEKYYDNGDKLGNFSVYFPHSKKNILDNSSNKNSTTPNKESNDRWHKDDQLFVKMVDEKDNFIGVISVTSSKSGEIPTDETVRPLEVFSCLISQILLYKKAQNEILAKEYKSEIADVTSGTLHNVKNILTSVKVSSGLIKENMYGQAYSSIHKANKLLRENFDNLEEFILKNPKGKKLLRFYLKIEEIFQLQLTNTNTQINRLIDKVDSIESIISVQQGYGGTDIMEKINVETVLNDALLMQSGSNVAYGVKIVKEIKQVRSVDIQKTKLIHILINLIKNARESMIEKGGDEKILTIQLFEMKNAVVLKIVDNGIGLSEQNKANMFSHGFTTKKDGHGFGLVSCKAYMEEMNGELWVESDGVGCGASFFLVFPFN